MSARVVAWLAWSLCVLCVVLAVASLILGLLNGRTLAVIFLAWNGPTIANLLTWTVSFSVVGALIASHRPENPIGWIFLAEGVCYGLLIAADEYAVMRSSRIPALFLWERKRPGSGSGSGLRGSA